MKKQSTVWKWTMKFNKQCDIDDKDEVQEITAAKKPMKKKKPVCVTCNQTLVTKNGGEKLSKKSRWSSGVIVEAKCSEIKRK